MLVDWACAETAPNPNEPAPQIETASNTKAERYGRRPDQLPDNASVTAAIQIDVHDPQNKHGNKCGGDGFHDLLTMMIRQSSEGHICSTGNTKAQKYSSSRSHNFAVHSSRSFFCELNPRRSNFAISLSIVVSTNSPAASSLPANEKLRHSNPESSELVGQSDAPDVRKVCGPGFVAGATYRRRVTHGFPISIAIAAARNGNGSDTAARNQTKRAGMNGISHRIMR